MHARGGRSSILRRLVLGFAVVGLISFNGTGSSAELRRIGPSSAQFACKERIQASIDKRLQTVPKETNVARVLETVASALPSRVRLALLAAGSGFSGLDLEKVDAVQQEKLILAVMQQLEDLNYCETDEPLMDVYLIADAVGQALLARGIETETLLGNDPEGQNSSFSSHLVMAALVITISQSAHDHRHEQAPVPSRD